MHAHWRDEPGKPALGRPTHSRRTAQARLRDRSVNGCSVYVPQQVATVSGLAHVSEQPCRGHRSDRPFCPSNDRVPDPLLSCHYTAWATNLAVVQRNGKPDCGVDLAPDHRGFPMGSGRRDISFGIGTLRMGQSSCSVCAPWVFETGRFHSDHPGKTLTLRGSLVRSGGSA